MALLLCFALLGSLFPSTQSEFVVSREGTKDYHRPSCPLIRDVSGVLAMTRAQAESRGLKPHAECDPSKTPPAEAESTGTKGTAGPAKPVFVMVDGGSYYHREKCDKLKNGATRLNLDAAAKKHWPCRTCKPPIRPRKGSR